MKRRKLLPALCALALTLSLLPAARAAGPFTDVKEGAWYDEAIQEAAQRELMTGVTSTTFQPHSYVTRSTVLTVLWRLEGCPEPQSDEGFPDVEPGAWYEKAARWAREEKIAAGYSTGALGPNDRVTREQLALFLRRYAVWKGQPLAEGFLTSFPDADQVSKWAVAGMKHAVGAGLITGTSAGTLSPQGYATRAELAVILQRLLTPAAG